MNSKKIEELAYGAEVWSKEGDFQVDLEVFAKLIIQECLSLSSDLNPFDAMDAAGISAESQYGSAAVLGVYDNTVDQYYDAIKNHFGVDYEC